MKLSHWAKAVFYLLMLGLPAHGALAASPEKTPVMEENSTDRPIELSSLAMHIRDRIANNFDETIEKYGNESLRKKFADISEQVWTIYPAETGWSFFAELAIPLISRADSDTPIFAYYHPWSDIFLLTQWELKDGDVRILDLALVPGSWIREPEELSGDPSPLWLAFGSFPPAGLTRAVSESVTAFVARTNLQDELAIEELLVDQQGRPFNLALAHSLATHNLGMNLANIDNFWFGQESESPEVVSIRATITNEMAIAFESGFGEMLAKTPETQAYSRSILEDMPMEYLTDLEVVYYLRDKEAAYVFLAPSGGPNLTLCLTAKRLKENWALTRVDALPLGLMLQTDSVNGEIQ